MDKLKRYEHFDTRIGEGLVCLEDDVEKLEADNERLEVENQRLCIEIENFDLKMRWVIKSKL